MSKSPEEITRALAEPFPPAALKRRNDRGSTFTYVEGHTVFRRLIDATGNRFDVQVIEQSITPYGQTSKGADRVIITARVRLTIPDLGSREHMGVQVTSIGSGEDLYKGAISDAIKKAATLFGVGLDLYGPDYEAGEVDDHPGSQRPAPRRDAPERPPEPRRAPERFAQASDALDTVQSRESERRRMHGLLKEHGRHDPHADAKRLVGLKGYGSTTAAPFQILDGINGWLAKEDSDTINRFFQNLDKADEAKARRTDPTGFDTGDDPGLPDDELRQIEAEIDADHAPAVSGGSDGDKWTRL